MQYFVGQILLCYPAKNETTLLELLWITFRAVENSIQLCYCTVLTQHRPELCNIILLEHFFSFLPWSWQSFLTRVSLSWIQVGGIHWIQRNKKLVGIRWTFHGLHFYLWQYRESCFLVYILKRERRAWLEQRFFSNTKWKTLPVQHPEFVGMCMMSSQLGWVGLLHMVSETMPSHLPKRYHIVVKWKLLTQEQGRW